MERQDQGWVLCCLCIFGGHVDVCGKIGDNILVHSSLKGFAMSTLGGFPSHFLFFVFCEHWRLPSLLTNVCTCVHAYL